MSRQHSIPVLLSCGQASALQALGFESGATAVSEADIQNLVQAFPGSLPIAEIDPLFLNPVAICTELNTPAGPIDNFFVTPSGLPVLVECKLWRNPEGRREVVGQILDYAKELSRWSSSDLQREVNRRLKTKGNAILDRVRAVDPTIDEIAFNDALTSNLRRGRFLLLIVGDGIREGVEAIAEYLQRHAGLHFSLGLVELPIYVMPNGDRLVVPRVLARTAVITRNVVAVPEGHVIEDEVDENSGPEIDPDRRALGDIQQAFWRDFLATLHIDDPEQAKPKPSRQGYVSVSMPAPNGSSWLTVYRDMKKSEVGLFLSSTRNSAGEAASSQIVADFDLIREDLGGNVSITKDAYDRDRIAESASFGSLSDPATRQQAFAWLGERVNTFINVLRPRIRSAVAHYSAE